MAIVGARAAPPAGLEDHLFAPGPRAGRHTGAVSTGTARSTREAERDISHGLAALRSVRGHGRSPVCVNRHLAR
jgi:hypothetical protein